MLICVSSVNTQGTDMLIRVITVELQLLLVSCFIRAVIGIRKGCFKYVVLGCQHCRLSLHFSKLLIFSVVLNKPLPSFEIYSRATRVQGP